MNRREFLRRLTAGAVAVSIPAASRAVAVPAGLRRLPSCELLIYGTSLGPDLGTIFPDVDGPAVGTLLARLRLIPVEATRDRVRLEAEAPVMTLASGTPGYFRLACDGRTFFQGTAGIGWADLNFNSSFIAGGTVAINKFELHGPTGGVGRAMSERMIGGFG